MTRANISARWAVDPPPLGSVLVDPTTPLGPDYTGHCTSALQWTQLHHWVVYSYTGPLGSVFVDGSRPQHSNIACSTQFVLRIALNYIVLYWTRFNFKSCVFHSLVQSNENWANRSVGNLEELQDAIHSWSTDHHKHWSDLLIFISGLGKGKSERMPFPVLYSTKLFITWFFIIYADPYSIFAVVWALVCLSICFKTKFYQHNIQQESWQLKYAEKVKPRIMFNVVFNIYSVNGRH